MIRLYPEHDITMMYLDWLSNTVAWLFLVEISDGTWAALAVGRRAGRGMDSCRLSAVVWRKEYILHVTRKGNRYGSMSLPSVTGASHIHTRQKGSWAAETTAKAPVCYCPRGSWVNTGSSSLSALRDWWGIVPHRRTCSPYFRRPHFSIFSLSKID